MDCTDISWLSSLTDLLEGYTVRAEESGMEWDDPLNLPSQSK